MTRLKREGFRFKVLRVVGETGPIDAFALAEALRLRYGNEISVSLLTRVLFEFDCNGWVHRQLLLNPRNPTLVSVFTLTRAGERALRTPAQSFMGALARMLGR